MTHTEGSVDRPPNAALVAELAELGFHAEQYPPQDHGTSPPPAPR